MDQVDTVLAALNPQKYLVGYEFAVLVTDGQDGNPDDSVDAETGVTVTVAEKQVNNAGLVGEVDNCNRDFQ